MKCPPHIMQYLVFIFSILLAGLAGRIGGVASEDGSSNARIKAGASALVRLARQPPSAAGGSPASTADFPFVAFITWYWTETRTQRNIIPRNLGLTTQTMFQCTGSLVGPKFVVTNAACFQPRIDELTKSDHDVLEWAPNEAWVRCGADDGWDGASSTAQTRSVVKVIIHQNYVKQTIMYDVDVALLQLKTPFVYGAHVKSPLHSSGFNDFNRMQCTVVGFGRTDAKSRSSSRPLLSYPTVLGGDQYCRYLQEKFDFTAEKVFDSFFLCGKPTTAGTECFREMGAPVVCWNMVTGILSQRRQKVPCGSEKDFSMYTMVGQTLVHGFFRRYAGNDDTPALYQLPPEQLLPPLEFIEERVVSVSSSTVLSSKVAVVALIVFSGIRAV